MLEFNVTDTVAVVFMNGYFILICILCALGIVALIKIIKACNIYIKEHKNKES